MHSLNHHQKYHNTAVTHKVEEGELYAGGAVTGRSHYFNYFQVLKGSTRETFNKRAKAVLRLDKTRVASLLDLHLVL